MKKNFFADANWPYKLELTGAIVTSPTSSTTDRRFIDYHYFHHLPTALAALLALPPENFDQAILPAGNSRPLYKYAALVSTDTRAEVASLYSIPLSAAIGTGEHPGLYLLLEGQAGLMAERYKLPLQRLSNFDPSSILLPLASYDVSDKHIVRPDPQVAGLISVLRGGPLSSKDAFQLHTPYYTDRGGMTMQISYHFDSLLHGLSGLLHHPVDSKNPPIQRVVQFNGEDTVLSKGDTALARVAYLPRYPWKKEPPEGFYLQLCYSKGATNPHLDLSALPVYTVSKDSFYQIATAHGGSPQELPAFTLLKTKLDERLRAGSKRTLGQVIAGQARRMFTGLGGNRIP